MSERISTLSSSPSRGRNRRAASSLRQDESPSFDLNTWEPDDATGQASAPVRQALFPPSEPTKNCKLTYDHQHADNPCEHATAIDKGPWMYHQQSIYSNNSRQSSRPISQHRQTAHDDRGDAIRHGYYPAATDHNNHGETYTLPAQGVPVRETLYAYVVATQQDASSVANLLSGFFYPLSPRHQLRKPLGTYTMPLDQHSQQQSPIFQVPHNSLSQLSQLPSHDPTSTNLAGLDPTPNLFPHTQETTRPSKRKHSGSDSTARTKRRYSPTSRSSVARRRKLGACASCRERKVKCHRPPASNQNCPQPSQRRTSAPAVTDVIRYLDIPAPLRERARSDISPHRRQESVAEQASTPKTTALDGLPLLGYGTPPLNYSGLDLNGIGLGVDEDQQTLDYFRHPSALDLTFSPMPERDEDDAPYD